jgi:hypothetical protein
LLTARLSNCVRGQPVPMPKHTASGGDLDGIADHDDYPAQRPATCQSMVADTDPDSFR